MQIHELPTISGSPSGGYFVTDNGTQTTKIDYTALAQAIIEQYNASTLAGTAQSVKAALDGLMQKSLPTEIAPRTTIASGDDLNAYISPGIYKCATASIAASLSNCPISNVGFNLDVVQLYNVAFAYQKITASTGTTAAAVVEVYERFINVRDSMYGTWKKVPTREEVDALSTSLGNFTCTREVISGASTQTYTLTHSHMYLVTVARGSNASAETAGIYIVTAYNGSGLCKTISASSAATVSVNKTTLTITTTMTSMLVSIMQIA